MKFYPLICSLYCILFTPGISNAQSPTGETIIAGLNKWHENNPQEKVFVQTDREQYAAGETVWFKSWCVIDNKPSFLSKIIYITLSDAGGKVIDKKMYSMNQLAAASGMFDLNNELKTGNYTLTAATLWMLNYPQFIFQKNISIYGADYKQKTIEATTGNKNQFIFFPEGGDLVETVTSQLAFKAVNYQGLPLDFKGSIIATDGSKVADIQSQHDGMGAVEITPAAGKNYTAKITFSNGQTGSYILPAAKKEGIVLQVNNSSPSRIAVLVNSSDYSKYNKIVVVAQSSGIPVLKADFNIHAGESATSISKKKLPAGLLQITAFDSAGNPLAERMVFIENHQVTAPAILTQIINTNKRGRNILSFRLDSADASSLSILVTDAVIDTVLNRKENIASSFLMSNDIKGYIHNPGYYFADKNPATLQNLDLLLMTQGWRRFTWKQVKEEENIILKYPVETFMNIKGVVKKSDRSEPLKNGFVTLITKAEDSTTILTNAQLTDKGEFIVDSMTFRTKAKIFYEGADNKNIKLPVDITIYPAYIDTLKQVPLNALFTNNFSEAGNDVLAKYLGNKLQRKDSLNAKVLQTVLVKTKVLSKVDSVQKQYVSPIFELSDQSLLVAENKNYLNLWQFLNQNVPGFNVNPFEPGGVTYASFSRYDGLSLTDAEQGIRFFINEMPVAIDALNTVNPEDVALVKIYKGATGFALGAESGAISLYTKKGADIKNAPYNKTFSTMEKIGFAIAREFYAPNYTTHPELNAKENDGRIIFYWQPNAKKTSKGEYLIEFHNNDVTKAFKIIVQGIDKNGQLIYKEQLVK